MRTDTQYIRTNRGDVLAHVYDDLVTACGVDGRHYYRGIGGKWYATVERIARELGQSPEHPGTARLAAALEYNPTRSARQIPPRA